MSNNLIISIDLDDVRAAGGVEQALHEYCDCSDTIDSGVVGPSFSVGYADTVEDYARRTMEEGGLYYLDVDDGRIAYAPTWDPSHDEFYRGQEIVWTDESVVRLECPDAEDAIDDPHMLEEMVRCVIRRHGHLSDREEWASLVRRIKAAAKALRDIDPEDLDE